MDYQDLYKNRAAAYRDFVQAQGLPVSRAKFFEDAARFTQPDKSLRLADLLAYVRQELKVDPLSGRSLRDQEGPGDREREREKEDLELRRLRAEVEGREKANRKDDAHWIQVVDHDTQMAAFAGRLEEALQQLTVLRLPELLHLAGADPARGAELAAALEELYAAAFTDAVRVTTQHLAFEDETVPPDEEPA